LVLFSFPPNQRHESATGSEALNCLLAQVLLSSSNSSNNNDLARAILPPAEMIIAAISKISAVVLLANDRSTAGPGSIAGVVLAAVLKAELNPGKASLFLQARVN
jgi:hypothetical protein